MPHAEISKSPVIEHSSQKAFSNLSTSADQASKDQPQTKLACPVIDGLSLEELPEDKSCPSKSLENSQVCMTTKPIKPGKGPNFKGSTLQVVRNRSLDDNIEYQHFEKVNTAMSSPLKKHEELQFKGNREKNHKLDTFREPSTKNLKMKSGKSKTTSADRRTPTSPCLENLESELLYIKASREAKFETDMEIRRAKEAGKLRKREFAVVTLLSRYSHMDDPSSTMAKESVISAILNYQSTCSSVYLHSKCQRILHRILRNRLCFEQLILEHVPMLIAMKMLSRGQDSKPCGVEDGGQVDGKLEIKRSQSLNDMKNLKTRTTLSDTTEDKSSQMRCLKRYGAPINQSGTTESSGTNWQKRHRPTALNSDLDFVADSIDDSVSDTTSVSSIDTLASERLQLLGDTASPLYPLIVSTCQYRQGLMVGLLLSDSFKGKMACILAVPYICQ